MWEGYLDEDPSIILMEIASYMGYLGVSGVFPREMERLCANKESGASDFVMFFEKSIAYSDRP